MTDYEAALKVHSEKFVERSNRLAEIFQRTGFAGKSADKTVSTDKTDSQPNRPLATVNDQCSMRERVERLEGVLQQGPQVDCPVSHHFRPGSYSRTMIVPAQVAATGAVHKTEHWTFVLGHCHLTTDQGVREFVGAHAFVSKPGARRAIATVKRTAVMTVHHTNTTDLNALVEELTESRAAELIGGSENKQALAQKRKGELE